MALFLEVVEGPNKGSLHRVKNGFKLGRTQGDIVIPDPKISSIHAEIKQSPSGDFYLIDLNSNNGLRVNGKRLPQVNLQPGTLISIGKTVVLVTERLPSSPPIRKDGLGAQAWLDDLRVLLKKAQIRNDVANQSLKAFDPPVQLQFLQGIQADKDVVLGFGPRKSGFSCLDIELLDPAATENCFEIAPVLEGARIKSLDTKVLLNGRIFKEEYLNEGDVIEVGQTKIQVHFLK